jgi:hypothetical protein
MSKSQRCGLRRTRGAYPGAEADAPELLCTKRHGTNERPTHSQRQSPSLCRSMDMPQIRRGCFVSQGGNRSVEVEHGLLL